MAQAMSASDQEREYHELTRSNRDLEQFAYVASHDLKSPLLVVLGFLELLAQKADQLDEDGRAYLLAADRGAQRMQQLIDDLLLYSQVGRTERVHQCVELGEVVEDVLVERGSQITRDGGAVAVGMLPTVTGDRTMLRQLFDNLLSNATKFARADRVLAISVESEFAGDEWLCRVVDNGVGVPADDRDAIFTMFSRLEQTDDRPGSGIGLAICHRVVQAHGGRIWVEDVDGGGTSMCFTLPAA